MRSYNFNKHYSLAELIEIGCYKCNHDLQFKHDPNNGTHGPRVFRCLTCDFVLTSFPIFKKLPTEEFLGYRISYLTGDKMWWQCIRDQVRVMYDHHVAFALDQEYVAHRQMLNVKKILMLQ